MRVRTYTACSAPFTFSIFRYVRIAKICSAAAPIRGAKTVIYRLRLLHAVGRSRGVNSSLLYKGRKSNFPLGAFFFKIHPQSFPQNRKKKTEKDANKRLLIREDRKTPWGPKKLQPRSKEKASVLLVFFHPSIIRKKEKEKPPSPSRSKLLLLHLFSTRA